jgi:hypothetical protein
LGKFYEYLQDFKDEVVEKLMGYTGKRIQSLKIDAINPKADSMKIADEVVIVRVFVVVMIAPDGILTTLYPPSVIDAGVPEVNEKWLDEPDLSFQTLKLLPELKVILVDVVSAASNHS